MEKFKTIKTCFLFVCCIMSISSFCDDYSKYEMVLLSFRGDKGLNVYNSYSRDSLITILHDDKKKEKYYEFDVIEKKDSMIKIIARNTLNRKTIKGWIDISNTGIYTRTYTDKMYPLYEKPNDKSKIIVKVFDPFGTLVQVLDIKNNWLKIRIKYKNKFIEYWLPYKYQCPSVYNSCS